MSLLKGIGLMLLFFLVLLREYESSEGLASPIYGKAMLGFRWIDLVLLGVCALQWLVATGPLSRLRIVPRTLHAPIAVFAVAITLATLNGYIQGGIHVFFDWRDILLGAGLTLCFACWIRTPEELYEGARIFALTIGLATMFYFWRFLVGGYGTQAAVPGVRTPLYDGPTLHAAVVLALLGCRFSLTENSPLRKTVWAGLGLAGSQLVILSLRRTFWGELAVGLAALLFLVKRSRLAIAAFTAATLILAVSFQGERISARAGSLSTNAGSASPYGVTNTDHINDLLDAWDHVKENPVLGIGLGRPYATKRIRHWKTESWGVHNGLLHTWLLYGLLGLIGYVWFHFSLLRWLNRTQRMSRHTTVEAFSQVALACVAGPFVMSLGFSPWPYGSLQHIVVAAFILGSLFSVVHGSER